MQEQPVLTAGIISDTHIPDRARALHPLVLSTLQKAGVSVILHAGDISRRKIITELEQVAPVHAVAGNRDFTFFPALPQVLRLELGGVVVALMHGHGGMLHYLLDKLVYLRHGYRFERYLPLLTRTIPEARVVIFGHTHSPENREVDGKLIFNPGSAGFGFRTSRLPSLGLLRIYPQGRISGEIIPLRGYNLVDGRWQVASQPKS